MKTLPLKFSFLIMGLSGIVAQIVLLRELLVQRGAVVVNNPHNATGRVFDEEAIRKLLVYSVRHGIYLIDDLAYQNVAPLLDLPEIKTARQVANELVWTGILSTAQAERVVTVHSMSKTDCLAGARLAVVEIRDRILRQRFKD